ncbi:MAG: hypothetical protein LUF78_10385 [Clostridiales bacterium]|nr:hypothetical protein [Clostridiales bacterium]
MYAVSDAFLTAVAANTRNYYWVGTITTTAPAMILPWSASRLILVDLQSISGMMAPNVPLMRAADIPAAVSGCKRSRDVPIPIVMCVLLII